MTPAEWRALLEAYIEGRIGHDAFERRFLDGWRANRDSAFKIPPPIDALFYVVEAYAAPELRDENSADEAEMLAAARKALEEMRVFGDALTPHGPSVFVGRSGARTYDRARAYEDMRRVQTGFRQLVGLGCAIAIAWVGLCLLQIFAVSDQIQSYLEWPAALSTFAGVVLAFVPIVGNALAFFGAKDVWNWPLWLAALVFFAAPAVTIISGWLRWMRRG